MSRVRVKFPIKLLSVMRSSTDLPGVNTSVLDLSEESFLKVIVIFPPLLSVAGGMSMM